MENVVIDLIGAGKRYRQEILYPGGSRDEMDSLKVSSLPRFPSRANLLNELHVGFLGQSSELRRIP